MTEQPEAPPAPAPAAEPAIKVENASRWFGNIVAVSDISFSVGPGITGLLGPNGAGKSTILLMAAGFLQPSSGSVRVRGQSPWRNDKLYRYTGLVPEREAIYPFLTGYEFVLLNARLHKLPDPREATNRAIRMVALEDAQHRATGGYSKGMKQRAKLAAALVHDPLLLLLDEPFNGVDPAQRLHMMGVLRDLAAAGRTIVFSSHILEDVERLADNVLVIVSGRLAASGDFHRIRRLMTDRPHTFVLRSSDNRRLAAPYSNQNGQYWETHFVVETAGPVVKYLFPVPVDAIPIPEFVLKLRAVSPASVPAFFRTATELQGTVR